MNENTLGIDALIAEFKKESGDLEIDKKFNFHELFKEEYLKKGQFFVREGSVPRKIGFITKGIMKYYYIDNKGNEWIKNFSVEGDFAASYGSFLNKAPSLYFIEALEDTSLLTLSYEVFQKLVNTSKIWSDAARKFTEKIYYKKEIREANFLKLDGTERYLDFLKEHKHLVNRVEIKDIASFIGISQVSLSRIRKNVEINK